MMSFLSYIHPQNRRPLFLLLSSLLVLSAVVIVRLAGFASDPRHAGASVPALAPVELASDTSITRLQETLRQNPDNSHAYAQLGLALLQKVRETGDASLYLQAKGALDEALARDPQQMDALVGQGILALALHDFEGALTWAEKARAVNPYRAEVLGIMVDAQVELGRYDEAVATAQAMVDMRPDLTSYSRVSYLRELHGDVPGAIEAMRAAASAGAPGAEATVWTQVQLGHLYFNSGDLEQAEQSYRQALHFRPGYAYAAAGLARVQAATGDVEGAIAAYEDVIERLPLPEFVISLGELYEATGQMAQAQAQYDLVRAMQQINAGSGMAVDLEMALFNADHGADPQEALQQARAAYAQRPGIYGADALAWALYKNGEFAEAERLIGEALRLGTQDAMLYYHAGKIYEALGDEQRAKEMLATALSINPYFRLGLR